MYKCYQGSTVEGAESFPLLGILGENLLQLGSWILVGFLLWPVLTVAGVPLLTIIWVAIVVVVQILLKKHNCSGCYYYGKSCHLGWGKISSAMFAQDSGAPNIGARLSLFYIVPPPVIMITSIVFGAIEGVAWGYWAALGLYVVFNIATFPVRQKSCSICAMRNVCSGSAAKRKG